VWRHIPDLGRYLSAGFFAAILGLLAWRWGRPLFAVAERNFWALNAALVQPLYTALRELAGMAQDRFRPGRDLAGRRRSAGLAAAGIMALTAGLVALAAGPLPTLRPAGPDLLATAMDALRNGAWVVAVYVMIAAPAWAVAEARAGAPQDLGPLPSDEDARWRVAHLSDIHVVGDAHGFRLECGRDGPRGNDRLAHTLALLEAAHAARPFDWILVTGDVTDAGRNAEFIAFEDAVAAHPVLRDRMLVIPGNHDVNIVDRANPARLELPIAPGGTLRRLRMLAATARLQGDRVRLVDRRTRRAGPSLNAWLADDGRGAALTRFMDRGGIRAGLAARRLWSQAFPQIVPPATPDGLGLVLLDSNAETHFSFTNALGLVGLDQFRAAEAAMAEWPRARWLVLLHHHLVEYPRPGAPLAARIGTALVNGHWVLQRLRRHARRVIVLHGHRHFDWMGECGGLRIVSAPSPVMGARDGTDRHLWLHALRPGEDGGIDLLAPRRLVIPGRSG